MSEFPCPGPITLDLRIGAGTVEIHAEPRATALVDVQPYDASDASVEAAQHTRVEMQGDTLLVAAPEAAGWLFRRSAQVRVTVRMPQDSSARVKVASADVTSHGRFGQFTVGTASGDVFVDQVTGDLTVNSASGDTRAMQVGGRLTVTTASGDASAQRVGGSIDIRSASGDLEVDNAGDGVRANTASGDVRVGAVRRGTVKVNSASGDISVGVIAGTGVWLDLNTISGGVRSDLDRPDPSGAGGDGTASHDLTLQIRTMSGDIDVHRVVLPATA